jgi:hypothetical protein
MVGGRGVSSEMEYNAHISGKDDNDELFKDEQVRRVRSGSNTSDVSVMSGRAHNLLKRSTLTVTRKVS